MIQFLYWPLTWGFLLVGIPILIHLINLLRHRRQKWAAMEFLLESYRRNRRWVMLKQWLLLLARMLAMALVVIMLAKWVTSAQWLSLLGGRTTHHYVLLDDSYSMGALDNQKETAYTRALRSLSGLVQDIASQTGEHQITLVRYSRADLAMRDAIAEGNDRPQMDASTASVDTSSTNGTSADSQESSVIGSIDRASDLLAQTVSRDPSRLIERVMATEPTALASSPLTAMELIAPSISAQTGELPIVYLMTDLRRNQYSDAESLRRQFQQFSGQDIPIQVIDCGESPGTNLTMVSLVPEQEIWAASVPLLVRFSVRNSSQQAVKNVVAKIRTIEYPVGEVSLAPDREFSGKSMELPPVVIESIEPGQTVARQFQVVFPSAGQHAVEVSLPDDVLMVDNRRWCVIAIQKSQRVLLVDGDARQMNAFYFESVIQPGERLRTGMTFERVDPAYLRDASLEELALSDVVALLDVPRLDDRAIDNLVEFASAGGGVLMLMGANTNLNFANERMYRDGSGLLPVQLERIEEPPEPHSPSVPSESGQLDSGQDNVADAAAQVFATEHAILQPLLKLASTPFFALRIRKHFIPSEASVRQSGVEVVATGPGGHPLIVDRTLGAGRTVAILTGLSSDWSSWAQDPTFVVLALRSLGYLGSFRRDPTDANVGSSLQMVVAKDSVLPEGEVLLPGRGGQRIRLQKSIDSVEDESISRLTLSASLLDSTDRSVIDGLLRSGIFEVWMTTADGGSILQNVAHNVVPEEGDLERISHQELDRQFQGMDVRIRSAESLSSGSSSRESTQSNIAMGLLILLLIGEQMLAYSASYHPRSTSSGSVVSASSRMLSPSRLKI